MNPSPWILAFFIAWTGLVILLWLSSFTHKTRFLTVVFFLAAILLLLLSVRDGLSKAFPLQVKRYALRREGEVIIGNSPPAHLIIYNPRSDRQHLKITFGEDGFSAANLSHKRRVEFDGQDLDMILLRPGERLRAGNDTLVLHSIKALPFSSEVKMTLGGERSLRFLVNSKEKIKRGDYTWIFSSVPPSILGINLFFWELFIALALTFSGLYLFFKGFYLSAGGIFLALAAALFPLLLIPSFLLILGGVFRERRPEGVLAVILFLLPMIFPPALGVKVKNNGSFYHFERKFSYGNHRVILGRTLYSLKVNPGKVELLPLGMEGFSGNFDKFLYSPLKIKSNRFLYLPFPVDFPPTPYQGKRTVLKGTSGELELSGAGMGILKFSIPFILIFLLYLASLAFGGKFVPTTVFFFLLTTGGIFVKTAGLFDPAFYFISRSYLKLGLLPAAFLYLILLPGFLKNLLSFFNYIFRGFSPRQSLELVKLEGKGEFSLFEALNRPLAGQILWVDFLFLLSLILIAAQFLMGGEAGIRGGGFSLQFFEAGKILLAIYLADWLFRAEENRFRYPFALPYLLIFLPFFLLIFTLGDFSPLAVFLPAILAHFLLVSRPLRVKIPLILLALGVLGLGVFLSLKFFFPPDVALRLYSWLKPGIFSRASEQFLRAFWLFKTGGLSGNFPWGFVNSHSVPLLLFDFPLALFVSNFGLAGAFLLVFTFLSLLPCLFRGPGYTYQGRWNFYALSFSHLVFLSQVSLPFLILVGLLPVMGQPLPFLSKANSDLLLFVLPFFLLINYLKGENLD